MARSRIRKTSSSSTRSCSTSTTTTCTSLGNWRSPSSLVRICIATVHSCAKVLASWCLRERLTILCIVGCALETVVRCLEGNVKEVLARQQIMNADTQLFRPKPHSSFIDEMVESRTVATPGSDQLTAATGDDATLVVDTKLDHGARLAFVSFLEALFGDVVYHFCSFVQEFAADELLSAPTQQAEKFLVFEVDSFLDAHIELGCREFFRQCFQTQVLEQPG